MYYKKVISIKYVSKSYYVSGNELLYNDGKSLYHYDLLNNKEIYSAAVNKGFEFIKRVKEIIIGISSFAYTFLSLDFQPIKITLVENGLGDYNLFNDNLVIVTTDYDYTNFLPKQGLQDVFSDKVLWETDLGQTIHIKAGQVYTFSFNEINKRKIINGEVIWSLKITAEKTVPKFIAALKSILILGLNENVLLGINTETGEVLWKIENFNNSSYVLDENEGRLKGITGIGYYEIDIVSGKRHRTLLRSIEEISNPEIFDSQRDNFVLIGDHIITTDCSRGIIAAFNTKTLKYDWIHEEKDVYFPAAKPIKFYDPYLFVLDNKSTLHIFKREDKIV
ncbi:hypothetical protein HX109_08610 [Galbibacter sp. BG1]|uniref:hypothetical protein n=1 Tax=Galbibacter sp. BG1 TaxID=1170699 RepID=UPI0015B8BDA3|nr:hypothetical protein [Galbibacter sp. BG1]QLE01625.1 hypothetical protein HX109_08610 [Galbibacter sp. BG1]